MSRLRNVPRVVAVVLTVMVLLSSLQVSVRAQAELDPIVILYDASHNEQHDVLDEENGLKLMIDMVNASTRYMVRINTEDLTDSVLNDTDILIIASPDDDSPFSGTEASAISEMLANGSSLFLLGDPNVDQTSEYWSDVEMQDMGENNVINDLLDAINITGVRFSINQSLDEFYSDVMFDYNNTVYNATYPYMIEFDASTWVANHPIFRNINELSVMTATLKPIGLPSGIASGYETSFAQYRAGPNSWANYSFPNMTLEEFEENPDSYSAINGTFPSWMSAFEYDESRIVILGSTLMFTGRVLDYPSADSRWFYMSDNARFFMNIINWLSQEFIEAPSAIVPVVLLSSAVLIVGVVFYIYKKIR